MPYDDADFEQLMTEVDIVQTQLQSTSDTLNIKALELTNRLNTHMVVMVGNAQGVVDAKRDAFNAHTAVTGARTDSMSYTDVRIQRLYDLIVGMLSDLAADLSGSTGDTVRGIIDGALTDWDSSWNEKYLEMLAESQKTIDMVTEFEAWVDDTINVLIPQIQADVAEAARQSEEAAQELQDEADLSRQEVSEMAGRWRAIADDIDKIRENILEMDFSNYKYMEELYRKVSVDFDGRFAQYDEKIVAAVGDTEGAVVKVETLETSVNQQTALLQNLERVMVDEFNQVSQQVTALAVGTAGQFDSAQTWHFDGSTEGWTGVWEDGYLNVFSATRSPALVIDATRYRQIRMRVRRVGTPTWNASVAFTGADGPVNPLPISEPQWVEDLAEITLNPQWSGTLLTLTFNFGALTADNYYKVDWIAVGRPAPGVSSADFLSERAARVEGDAVTAVRVDALESRMTNTDGSIESQANAIDGLETRVERTEEGFTAQAERITILDSKVTDIGTGLSGVANAVDALTTKVDLTGDDMTVLARKVTALEAGIEGVAGANALDELTTKVSSIDGVVTSHSRQLLSLNASIGDKANTTALSALDSRVTETEIGIDTISRSIISLSASIKNIATTTAVSDLSSRVVTAEGSIDTMSRDITSLKASLDGVADTTAIELLEARVKKDEDKLVVEAGKIVSLQSAIGTKANASAVSALNTRVGQTEEGLKAQAESITALGVQTGRFGANALFRMSVQSTPAGSQSRIGLHAEATADGRSHSAGIYIDAKSDGTSAVLVSANRFGVVNGINGANAINPFNIVNGRVYITEAVIQELSIGRGKIGDNEITMQWAANSNTISINLAYRAKVILMTSAQIMGTYSTHTTHYEVFRNNVRFDTTAFSVDQYTMPYSWMHAMTLEAGTHTFRFKYSDRSDVRQTRIAVFGAYK